MVRWTILVLLAIVACLFTMVMVARGQDAPQGNAANGRKLFAANGCYQCHGYEAQGATATGPRLAPNPISWAAFSKYVRQPTGQMPPYTAKVVVERDLADIYAFLKSVAQAAPAKSIPLLNQ